MLGPATIQACRTFLNQTSLISYVVLKGMAKAEMMEKRREQSVGERKKTGGERAAPGYCQIGRLADESFCF